MTSRYDKRPNFIVYMPDQLRYDCVGAFGNTTIKTPNIDRLALNGVKFTNCYLQHSVCSQSRASIVTGKYPHETGHRGLTTYLRLWEDNFFKTLKENDYHVVSVGKRGDIFAEGASEESLNEYGFIVEPEASLFEDMREKLTRFRQDYLDKKSPIDWSRLYYTGSRDPIVDFDEAVIQSAEKWLDGVNGGSISTGGKPWILFLPLFFPHCPFGVEDPYFSMYDRSAVPSPLSTDSKTGHEPAYMKRLREKHGLNDTPLEVWHEIVATYYGMISRIDDQLGRIISKVEESGLQKSTLTIFCTDHGEYLGDHGLIEKWPSGVSEQLVHEPLIVSGLNLPKGKTVDSLCEMVDLAPTLFEFAQLGEAPFAHNGKSLVPLLYGETNTHKDYVYSEGGFLKGEDAIIEIAPFPYDLKSGLQHEDIVTVGRVIAIRSKEYTFVYRLYEKNELYSRVADLAEAHNLIDEPEYAPVAQQLESQLLRWMVESSGLPPKLGPRHVEVKLPKPGSTTFESSP